MKIGIFCSANDNIHQDFIDATRQLGEWMASNSHTLVYGGCDMGLMRTIGHAVHAGGGRTIGVVPQVIEEQGRQATCLDIEIPVADLAQRKEIMLLQSDIIVALPGGIGTLDEVFTVAAANSIGLHNKRVVLLNINGFWDATLRLLDSLQEQGFIRGDYHDMITSVGTVDELKHLIATFTA